MIKIEVKLCLYPELSYIIIMEKADKFSLVLIIILIVYVCLSFIFNIFVKDPKLADFFAILTFMIILTCFFIFVGYLIIKKKKYARNQRIFLLLLLVIIGFIDIFLLIIATISGLTIYGFILGIFNSISLAMFAIIAVIIESKSSKI